MIKLENIQIKAGNFSLSDISLEIERNQCGVIIGPTGCGKSILLQSIVGFRKINSGKIHINGFEISKTEIEKRGIAYLPQEATLFPHLNVEENIFYGLNISKIKNENQHKFTIELCDLLGITNLFKRNIHNLSGGEQQRIAIARALAPGNKILLLDEPFSALNESFKKELWLLIKQLQHKFGLTILVVTHDIEEAFFLGDTIHVLIDGKFLRSGKKDKIYRYPKSVKVAKFLGITNIFNIKVLNENSEFIEVFCNELNENLKIDKNRIKNQKLALNSETKAGIRAFEISIIKKDKIKAGQDNILKAMVENIYLKGNSHTVIFKTIKSNYLFEIEVPDRAFKALKIEIGAEKEISFRSDSIFILDLD